MERGIRFDRKYQSMPWHHCDSVVFDIGNVLIYYAPDDFLQQLFPGDEQMQKDMLERARAHRDAHTYVAVDYETFKDTINNKPGFVKAMWCGDRACEDKIKDDVQATSRCMPFDQEHLADTCVCCGKPAKKMVYWGRAYC